MIETTPSVDELLAAWRDAQRVVEHMRLDAPSRSSAEDRLHDARIAYHERIAELERLNEDDVSTH